LPDPQNTYTVSAADAHSHTASQAGIPGASKADAILTWAQAIAEGSATAALVQSDTWTITVTQP
jgi:hypothetical protein